MNPQALAIGVDIGGTSVKLGVVELESGKVIETRVFVTPEAGASGMASEVAAHVRELAEPRGIRKLGVGVPGAMNLDRSLVRYPPNLKGWGEEPFKAYLTGALPEFTIEVDNDAKVATLAEGLLGAGRDSDYFMLATLGTGVGGGIYADGKIFRGASGGAGEFGHVSIDFNGPLCGCGQRGCIEAYLGQRHLSRRTLEALRESGRSSELAPFLRSGELTPRDIADAASRGDAFAREVFQEAGTLLGIAFANVAILLDIHLFIVAGGVAQAGEILLGHALASLREHALPNQRELITLRQAELITDAGLIGAALLTR